jgi:hypothetical protein
MGARDRQPGPAASSAAVGNTVTAGPLTILAAESTDKPWRFTDALWDEYLPDEKPRTGPQWRRGAYAIQAAGCPAGGVWLDVGATESCLCRDDNRRCHCLWAVALTSALPTDAEASADVAPAHPDRREL